MTEANIAQSPDPPNDDELDQQVEDDENLNENSVDDSATKIVV